MKTIHLICAARPNFMKIAPLYHILKDENWCQTKIVHTGQHYDYTMSQAFFDDFDLPTPHYHLGIGSGSHAEQTGNTMIAYEKLCQYEKPDLVVVVGDVNATLACTIAAKKVHLKVAHLEAGLRSFDRSMPEEINRVATDALCDEHWTPSQDANDNLSKEGILPEQIHLVGNIMIDAFCMFESAVRSRHSHQSYNLDKRGYIVLTLHRPVNVDNADSLSAILDQLASINLPVIFPCHPRTKQKIQKTICPPNLKIIEPLRYTDFMSLVLDCQYVISDSGGIQEETTYLSIPCFTLRDTTERPITVTMGSNQLVAIDDLLDAIKHPKIGTIPPMWDGKTATRIRDILRNAFSA